MNTVEPPHTGNAERGDKRALEARRRYGVLLCQQGHTQREVAALLGVTQGAVSRWVTTAKTGGSAALVTRSPSGAPSKLSPEQLQLLPTLLAQGPERHGFARARWTRHMVAEIIYSTFGVVYSDENISYILRKIGWEAAPLRQCGRCRV